MARSNDNDLGEVYIEFFPQGSYVKVNAICANTGFEVSVVGDARATEQELKMIAVRKLRYVMRKAKEKGSASGPNRGIIV